MHHFLTAARCTEDPVRIANLLSKGINMLTTVIIIVLLVSWVVGYAMLHVGSIIHLLLVVALVLVIRRLLQERKAKYESLRLRQ